MIISHTFCTWNMVFEFQHRLLVSLNFMAPGWIPSKVWHMQLHAIAQPVSLITELKHAFNYNITINSQGHKVLSWKVWCGGLLECCVMQYITRHMSGTSAVEVLLFSCNWLSQEVSYLWKLYILTDTTVKRRRLTFPDPPVQHSLSVCLFFCSLLFPVSFFLALISTV